MTGRRAAAAADAVVMVCINLSGARAAPRRQHGSHLALSRRPAGRVPGAAAQRPVVHRHAAAAASVPARHLASILGRIDADDRRRVPGERRSGRIIELSVRGKVESIHAVDQPTINNLYSSTTQQTDTDRQTDKIQLTNTTMPTGA